MQISAPITDTNDKSVMVQLVTDLNKKLFLKFSDISSYYKCICI